MSLKKELKKASKLIDSWQINEADKILNDLHSRDPENIDVKILLAVTQNSLHKQVIALQLLDSILSSNPEHEHAIAMYPSVVFELADSFIEQNQLPELKERLEKIEKMGFQKVGFDLGIAYKYLSQVHEKGGNTNDAIEYLKLQKQLYEKDEFLSDVYIKSGEIDEKLDLLIKSQTNKH